MKDFLGEEFLLGSATAVCLYHNYAKNLPIIDYHCHINPQEIFRNAPFENIYKLWLGGDHYKWRAMRSCGVPEKLITGIGDERENFRQWAKTLSLAVGNPLYHWTALELKRYFNYSGVLNDQSADEVWDLCNSLLKCEKMLPQSIIRNSRLEVICTTDDPTDSLEYHKALQATKDFNCKVLPAFRPDMAVNIDKPTFTDYIKKLSKVSGISIVNIDDLLNALEIRIEFFASMGCKISDHALEYPVYAPVDKQTVNQIFLMALADTPLTQLQINQYKTAILSYLGKSYAKHNWVMQLHYGVLRNNNSSMFKKMGPDTGYDSIGSYSCAKELSLFLNHLNSYTLLPKTIIYPANQYDNEIILSMVGCFQGEGVGCKMQLGSAWWFNDTKTGMEKHLTDYANLSVLGNFVGMLTDSRSLLSFTRHEYFRRIVCNLIGNWIENGEYPNDLKAAGKIVENICYYNAKNYFNF